MPGVEKLKSKILEEARLTAGIQIERAEKEADAVRESARCEAARKSEEILSRSSCEAEERKRRILAYAGLEARKRRLQTKQELVDEVFKKAIFSLNSIPESEYVNILAGMIASLVKSGNEEIILSEKDRKAIGVKLEKTVNEHLKAAGRPAFVKLSRETRNQNGGFILRTGDTEVNHSFDTVLRVQREQLEGEVVKTLFEDKGGESI